MAEPSPPPQAGDLPNLLVPKTEPGTDPPPGDIRNADPEVPDETTVARGEEVWSKEHPPIIFGMLDPPETLRKIKNQTASMLHNVNHRKVEGSDGLPLRDLPNLPRYISSKNEPIEMEFFFRSDPRVGYNDVRGRQAEWRAYDKKKYKTMRGKQGKGNPLRRPNNGINNARRRAVRGPLLMRDWSVKHEGRGSKVFIRLLDALTQEQIDHNTTWVVTEAGIHPPTNEQLVFPHLTFLSNSYPHKPTKETQRSLDLLARIRNLAAQRGLSHWEELPRTELPSSWFKTTVRRKATKKQESDDDDEEDSSSSDSEVEPRRKKTKRTSGIKKEGSGDHRGMQLLGNTLGQQGRSSMPSNGYGAYYPGPMVGQQRPHNSFGSTAATTTGNGLQWSPADGQLVRELNQVSPEQFRDIMHAAQATRARNCQTTEEMLQINFVRNLRAADFVLMTRLRCLSNDKWNTILSNSNQGTPSGTITANGQVQTMGQHAPQIGPQNGSQIGPQTVPRNEAQNGSQSRPQNSARDRTITTRTRGATQRGSQPEPNPTGTIGTQQAQPLGLNTMGHANVAYAGGLGDTPYYSSMSFGGAGMPMPVYPHLRSNAPVTATLPTQSPLPIRTSSAHSRTHANAQADNSPDASENGGDDGFVHVDSADVDADGVTDPDVSPRSRVHNGGY